MEDEEEEEREKGEEMEKGRVGKCTPHSQDEGRIWKSGGSTRANSHL